MGKQWKQWQALFWGASKSFQVVTAAMKLKDACSWKKSYDLPRQRIKKQRHYFANTLCLVKAMVFPLVMYGCESWTVKKAEHQRMLFTGVRGDFESPLDCKEIQVVHTQGNQFWIFIGRTDAKVEAPILWPPDVKNWLIGKDSDARKDIMQEEKWMTEDEMFGWHHGLNEHKFE